jgi:hypothetical protein
MCVLAGREPKALLWKLLLEPADTVIAEWSFAPSLDSICGAQRMSFSICHASRLHETPSSIHTFAARPSSDL